MAGAFIAGDVSKGGGSGSGIGVNIMGSSETGRNLDAILNPGANLNRIKSKLDKATGIDELKAIQTQFDLETRKLRAQLRAQKEDILSRINLADLEASRAVRESRINQARQRGRSSTILSR
jgi:hypothetical protein